MTSPLAPLVAPLAAALLLLPGAAFAVCGDGVIDASEGCDDINTTPGGE